VDDLKKLGAAGTVALGSALESNENNQALKKFAEALGVTDRQYTAREVEHPSSDDFLIKADKNPNRAGVEHLGFKKFSGGIQVKVVLALGSLPPSALKTIKQEEPALLVLLASNEGPELELADVVLPTTTFAEQTGSFTNFQHRVQKFDKALETKGQAMAAWQWIEKIAGQLELGWEPLSPEGLLREGFGFGYKDLENEGKVIG
jgi:NADH dehydrogenase/NADH:ubiquinone oxidoreductase subunit G